MSDTAIKEVVVRALAEEGGWLRDRDIEKAKKMLKLDISAEKVAEVMELSIDTVTEIANTIQKLPAGV